MLESLETYGDESGIDSPTWCVVAGFCGSSKQWRIVEDKWRRVCGGIVFHGKEFFGRDDAGKRIGVYRDWSDQRAQKFIESLFDSIGDRLTLVGGVVDVKAFRSLSVGARRYLTMAQFKGTSWRGTGAPTKPWFIGFASALVQSALCVKHPGLKVNFWFDRQNEYESRANELFAEATEPGALHVLRDSLGALVFAPKHDYPGLQVADLVAFTGGSVNQRGRPKHNEQAYAVRRMLALPQQRVLLWSMERMTRALNRVQPEIRADWDTAKLRTPKKPRQKDLS